MYNFNKNNNKSFKLKILIKSINFKMKSFKKSIKNH